MSGDEASANQRRRWFGILRAIGNSFRDGVNKMSCTDWLAAAAAVATLFIAAILFLILRTYWDQQRSSRLNRISEAIAVAERSVTEEESREMVRQFPGLWQKNTRFCLGREQAEAFLEAVLKPDDSAMYKRFRLARKHLNGVAAIAFPYYYGRADRRILATISCGYVTRSSRYFGHLIAIFGEYFGGGQSWQVIAKAAKLMEDEWGTACINLPGEQRRVERPYYRLPAEAVEPPVGERKCVTGPAFPDAK